MRISGDQVPRPGAVIYADDKKIGSVTSAVNSPALGRPIALGYVRREYLTPGTQIAVQAQDTRMPAEVTPLPFYGR